MAGGSRPVLVKKKRITIYTYIYIYIHGGTNDDDNNNLCASAAGPLENAISYLCVCVLLQGCRKEGPQTKCCGKKRKTLRCGDLVDSRGLRRQADRDQY